MRIPWLAAPALAVTLAVTACAGGTATPSTVTAPTTGYAGVVAEPTPPPSEPFAQRAVPVTAAALAVRAEPSGQARVRTRLPATTPLGSPVVLLGGQVRSGWVEVSLPTRPNGSTGWVPADQVRLEPVTSRIVVDLAARRLRLDLDGVQAADTSAAVGTSDNPTPAGTFYVTDRVRPTDPDGAYGAFALGLSAHSDTLSEFGGGDGQIGIHGTNNEASIGRRASHGCIRVPAEVAELLSVVPLGTPVVIT